MKTWTIWFKTAEADTWQPLELYRSLPTRHYRLAARLPRSFKYLNWRWKFYPQLGDIQYYDFQGQTDEEGLISLLDLNTVQPGTWQLIGRPDVLDELGGENWQIEHQFQVIASLASALIIPPLIPSESDAANDIVPHPPETSEAIENQVNDPITLEGQDGLDASPEISEALENQVNDPVTSEAQDLDLDDLELESETLDNHVLVSPEMGLVNDQVTVTELTETEPHAHPTGNLEIAAKLAHQIDSPAIALDSPLAIEPVMTEQTETQFSVLAEPDFVPEEEISASVNHLRPVNYLLELIDPEKAATYKVDITVMLDDRRQSVPLDLPNPRQMVRLLHRPIPKPKSPLPPKLSKV